LPGLIAQPALDCIEEGIRLGRLRQNVSRDTDALVLLPVADADVARVSFRLHPLQVALDRSQPCARLVTLVAIVVPTASTRRPTSPPAPNENIVQVAILRPPFILRDVPVQVGSADFHYRRSSLAMPSFESFVRQSRTRPQLAGIATLSMGIAKQFSPGQTGAMTQRSAGRSAKKRQNWSSQAQAKSRMIEQVQLTFD
jgi:hypothetical protein